jgi:hypothetical protein
MKTAIFAGALVLAVPAAARDVAIVHNNSLLKFTYQWPRQAAADRRLDALLRSAAAKEWRERLAGEEDNRKNSDPNNLPFRQGYDTFSWQLAGETPRLLSLQGAGLAMSSGMAHPEHWNEALLWDRRARKEISLESLFSRPATFEPLTRTAYCAALAKEQDKRLERAGGGDPDPCPKYTDLAIAPADKDKDGRFDSIEFVAPPYVAGFYALGEFVIALPVTAAIVRAIKPEYRSSFEAQRQ